MNAGCASLDHALHKLKGIQAAAEASFRIRYDGSKPMNSIFAFRMVYLVGSGKGVVDGAHHRGHAVSWIQALVGIHLAGQVSVPGNLPAAEVNSFESCLYLLHRLITGQSPQCRYKGLCVYQVPEPF